MSKWYPCIYCTEDLHCMKFTDEDHESFCVLGSCTDETPSNGDRIRRMTDEEIAQFIWYQNHLYLKTPMELVEWLKQEVKE